MLSIGIDPGLNKTGLVILKQIKKGVEVVYSKKVSPPPKVRGALRLLFWWQFLTQELFSNLVLSSSHCLVVIEDYTYGRTIRRGIPYQIGELGGLIRVLSTSYQTILVNPTTLKKYVTGWGLADKELMKEEIIKRWGFEDFSDDVLDAYGLARLGLAWLNKDFFSQGIHLLIP